MHEDSRKCQKIVFWRWTIDIYIRYIKRLSVHITKWTFSFWLFGAINLYVYTDGMCKCIRDRNANGTRTRKMCNCCHLIHSLFFNARNEPNPIISTRCQQEQVYDNFSSGADISIHWLIDRMLTTQFHHCNTWYLARRPQFCFCHQVECIRCGLRGRRTWKFIYICISI